MIIKIPFRTPTINHLYWHRGNIKILKTEAKKLREEIIEICDSIPKDKLFEEELKVTIRVYENWYCKNGEIKKMDILNREKFLIDSIFKGLGLDDKLIFECTMIKEQSAFERAEVEIEVLNGNPA